MAQERVTRELTSETGDGWRRLGFYHEPDHDQHLWRFVGSRAGLGQLAGELRRCAEREPGSEHGIRLGPYEDLVLYRWDRSGIDDEGIYGPPDALTNLADLVEGSLGAPGSSTVIGPEYASDVEYRLRFEVRESDFDPTTVMPVPGVADADLTNGQEVVEPAELSDFFVSPSVPCHYYDPDASLTETHGIVYLEGLEIVMQFETTDAFFEVYKSGTKEVRLPLEEVSTVRLKRSLFGGLELGIQARDMMSVSEVPNSKAGLIRLKFKRADRELGEELAGILEEALVQVQERL